MSAQFFSFVCFPTISIKDKSRFNEIKQPEKSQRTHDSIQFIYKYFPIPQIWIAKSSNEGYAANTWLNQPKDFSFNGKTSDLLCRKNDNLSFSCKKTSCWNLWK